MNSLVKTFGTFYSVVIVDCRPKVLASEHLNSFDKRWFLKKLAGNELIRFVPQSRAI